ncbi:RHS repeat-associated protein [Kibdelosporangium banguiense]|uniref:RHS repeat-associated protein n=1 Tax=Kibdelosporangium banguiense TaxID=1365924 RepID=A0ABS4TTS3_9PSEU|nr:RHS repeat-associated core domain-containing protein [Kibdelosporangium banguiense]MBP2327792.1 RHS repeat-associated protein [Kibdelosporangium banguiense]
MRPLPPTRLIAGVVGLALAISPIVVTPASAAAAPAFQPHRESPVSGENIQPMQPGPNAAAAASQTGTSSVIWPKPAAAEVTLTSTAALAGSSVRAGDLPVWIGRSATAPDKVNVEVLPQRLEGPVLRINRTDGAKQAGAVSVEVDYSGFAKAYGGDWALRLKLASVPECALTTPERDECAAVPLPTKNNGSGKLTAQATASGLYTLLAAESSGGGDYKSSSLAPSATWAAGGSSGDFTWNYPMTVPPAVGGPTPDLALSYSSGSMDGRTSATNNQPSWVGEGFEFSPGGYIERRYVACSSDMGAGANNTKKTGDMCWRTDNATFSLNGKGGELILDTATGVWKPKNDDGTKVERLTGADNGDQGTAGKDVGEYWKMTSRDGTEFYFGLNKLPGWTTNAEQTKSAWTMPVYGNNANEPCHKTAFADSYCNQAWRWNLDYVVDRHNSTMSYFYNTETNNYARELTASKVSGYVRAGNLARIDYGQFDGQAYTTKPVGQVVLTTADRCRPGTAAADCVSSKPDNWPDTPLNQACTSTTSCPNKFSPTFWTQKRLAEVKTRVIVNGTTRDVNKWTLAQSYPSTGDGTRDGMWLASVQHTGLAAGSVALPPTTFDGAQMANRVDATNDSVPPMNWWRVNKIISESGGQIAVTYELPECLPTGVRPAPDTNEMRCQPLKWTPDTPDNAGKERTDWFHKYVVKTVTETDLTTGVVAESTEVEYPRKPAWHYDQEDGLVPAERKTWSQWRGYDLVRVRKGNAAGSQSMTDTRYFRGMDGDKLTSGTKQVDVIDSKNGKWRDSDPLTGTEREEMTYDKSGGILMSRSISDPWLSAATATRIATWGTTQAFRTGEQRSRQGQLLSDGTWRETGSDNIYDDRGVLEKSFDFKNIATADDDQCTTYSYAAKGSTDLVELPYRKQVAKVGCDKPVTQNDIKSDDRTYYDGNDTLGAPPTKGDVTRVEELTGFDNGTPKYVTTKTATHDAYGRARDVYDVDKRLSRTTYTPETGAPTTISATNPLNQTTVTDVDPAWGADLAISLPGNRRTKKVYDALGRETQEWKPGADPATRPADEITEYLFRNNGANVVMSKDLQADGSYDTDYELYDGNMQLRQTQAPAPGGGRTIIDHIYDAKGLEVKRNGPYINDAPPGFEIFKPVESELPAQTVTEYDGADRPTASIFKVKGAEKWRTTYRTTADRYDVDPPDGETPTTQLLDADGRVTELRQYKGNTFDGDYDKTSYTYDDDGNLLSITDPADNVWRYSYDLRGRKITSDDPDLGHVEYSYDDADRVTSTKDARGTVLVNTYDNLGRKTAVYEGSVTGTKRAEWTFDTVSAGMPASSTRYLNGAAYKTEVTGYDPTGKPTGNRITIPASEGKLAGTYDFATTYTPHGELKTQTLPAVAGFAEETLTYGYNGFGLPTTLDGKTSYVKGTTYTPYGEMESATLSTGGKAVKQTFEYEDGTRRLKKSVVQSDSSATDLSNATYSYDAAGNVLKVADTAENDTQCFGYDYLRRLTSAFTPQNGDCASAVQGGPAPYALNWTFDKTGNRSSEVKTTADGKSTTSVYAYPPAGQPQPHTLRSVTTGNKVDSYAYDKSGNTIARKGQALEWDAEGKLAKVTENGKTTSYVYDATGERIIRRDDTGTTLYLGATEVRLGSSNTLSAVRYYSHSGHVVAVRNADGKVNWITADRNNTGQLAIDADTQAVQRRRITPYGDLRGAAPSNWPGERGFVNGVNDPSTGLVHLGSREYDRSTGRFISVDPVIDEMDPQQLNGYAYSNNSPVTYADPDGEWGFSLKTITKVVFQPIVKTIIQPVTVMITRYTPVVIDSVRKFIADPIAVTKSVLKKIPSIKKIVQTIRKVVHNAGNSVRKFYKKHIEPRIEATKKKWDRFRKAAATNLKKAAKATWEGTKKAAKWVGKESMPGGKVWGAVKLGVGVGAMFGCVPCGAVAAGMSAVDMVVALADPKGPQWGTAAIEGAGVLTFGMSKKFEMGLKAARAGQFSSAAEFGQRGRSTQRFYQSVVKNELGLSMLRIPDATLLAYDAIKYNLKGFSPTVAKLP